MRTETIRVDKGLEGVEVGETAISLVDGERGNLSYRGVGVDDLVTRPFSEVAAWVLTGEPGRDFEAELAAAGSLSRWEATSVLNLPDTTHPMHVLQSMTPVLERSDVFHAFGEVGHGLTIAAKLPAIIATYLMREDALETGITNYIERFLTQIGAPVSGVAREAFEVMQILQIEHGFNASTFAGRVVASTLAPVENVLAAAIGTLHGRLHGGADQAALETADGLSSPEQARTFVDRCIAEKARVMGMGHREYRVVDPRAKYAKRLAAELTRGTEHEATFEVLKAIEERFTERMAEKDRALYANIEFYKGLIFRALGLPTRFFTTSFAMARVFGYVAHFMESRIDNRLIRPAVRYVGPCPGR
ncbi:MAG: citrate/2-methylcitrate synthase [Pseudomonadales bacterium]|nr:citrate/2-methylcitrate synthase [Pseudomonadales bacterium]MDP6470692.1 citrate/2-methylcitrate synthase [Pseudomonadales bacterium]MDP6828356.1 citrate/2-methylcitrate synthase [Pseudomonadales bacterium]MDP6972094.1 citrate/2-methylcitrate synthase [Pseudomonadales bacterium]